MTCTPDDDAKLGRPVEPEVTTTSHIDAGRLPGEARISMSEIGRDVVSGNTRLGL